MSGRDDVHGSVWEPVILKWGLEVATEKVWTCKHLRGVGSLKFLVL